MKLRSSAMLLALIFGVAAVAQPALAFDTSKLGQWGSVPLEDLSPLLKKTPKLNAEVEAAVSKSGKKADEIMCTGQRFPGSWEHLGGQRVAPYVCQIGERWVKIRARVRVTGDRGKAYEKVTRVAMKNAKSVQETRLTWAWSDEEPKLD